MTEQPSTATPDVAIPHSSGSTVRAGTTAAVLLFCQRRFHNQDKHGSISSKELPACSALQAWERVINEFRDENTGAANHPITDYFINKVDTSDLESWWLESDDAIRRLDDEKKLDETIPLMVAIIGNAGNQSVKSPFDVDGGALPWCSATKTGTASDDRAQCTPTENADEEANAITKIKAGLPCLVSVLMFPVFDSSGAFGFLATVTPFASEGERHDEQDLNAARGIARALVRNFLTCISDSSSPEAPGNPKRLGEENWYGLLSGKGKLNDLVGVPRLGDFIVSFKDTQLTPHDATNPAPPNVELEYAAAEVPSRDESSSHPLFVHSSCKLTLGPTYLSEVVRTLTEHLGPSREINLANLLANLGAALGHEGGTKLKKDEFDRHLKDELSSSRHNDDAPKLDREFEDNLFKAREIAAAAHDLSAQCALNERRVMTQCEELAGKYDNDSPRGLRRFALRASDAVANTKLILDQMEGELAVKQVSAEAAARHGEQRLIQSNAGITGLLAGVAAALATFQLEVSRWWGIAAGLVLFSASLLWIGRHQFYRPLHVLPPAAAIGALAAATFATWASPSRGQLLGAAVAGFVLGCIVVAMALGWWDARVARMAGGRESKKEDEGERKKRFLDTSLYEIHKINTGSKR